MFYVTIFNRKNEENPVSYRALKLESSHAAVTGELRHVCKITGVAGNIFEYPTADYVINAVML